MTICQPYRLYRSVDELNAYAQPLLGVRLLPRVLALDREFSGSHGACHRPYRRSQRIAVRDRGYRGDQQNCRG